MRAAELKAKRKALGMSIDFIAAALGRNSRTIDDFEAVARKRDVPEYVEEFINRWWDLFAEHVNATLEYVESQIEEHGAPPKSIDLTLFATDSQVARAGHAPMTKTMHEALVGHIIMALTIEGISVDVKYMPFDVV